MNITKNNNKLRNLGFKVVDKCIVCYGDEDTTWEWNPGGYKNEDVIEYINAKDLKNHSYELAKKLATVFYDKEENKNWFLSKAEQYLR